MNRFYTLFLVLSSFLLLSYSSGPGLVGSLAVTGAPGESTTCGNSSCHSGNAFDQVTTLELLDNEGNLVDSYTPETEYQIRLNINANSGAPSAYGFQMVALQSADNSTAGTWGDLSDQVRMINLMDRDYVEQTSPMTENSITLPWVAPSAGTGSIDLYATGNAVNRNGSAMGDDANAVQLTLEEAITSSTDELSIANRQISIYPNPTHDNITVTLEDRSIDGQAILINILGREMYRSSFANGSLSLSMQDYDAGIYLLSLVDSYGDKISTRKVIKR